MANIKSAKKRASLTIIRTRRNKAIKSEVRTAIRKYLQAIDQKDVTAARSLLTKAVSVIDKADSKGVIHKNTAARKKSRLSVKLARLAQGNAGDTAV